MPVLKLKQCETNRFYVAALGTEVDIHTLSWDGEVITRVGTNEDMLRMLPVSMHTVDYVPSRPANFLLQCNVSTRTNEH